MCCIKSKVFYCYIEVSSCPSLLKSLAGAVAGGMAGGAEMGIVFLFC